MPITKELQRGLRKVDQDLDFMMSCFREVLEELGHKDLAGTLPWMGKRRLRGIQIFSYRGVQAYSIAFQLLNMVEENASAQSKRLREDARGLAADPGTFGRALAPSCLTFVSQAALDADLPRSLGLQRRCVPVVNTREIGKASLRNNTALPKVEVDPQTYEVFADGELLTCEPAEVLPMAQRYFLI